MTRLGLARGALLVGSALALACAATLETDGADARCEAEPVGQLVAFLEEDSPPLSLRLTGTVVAISSTAPEAWRYVIRDAAGAERRLAYRAPGGALPVRLGRTYDFQVDYVGGAPAASGLLVRDAAGLVFAGMTDTRLGSHVLKDGLPELAMALVASGCASRRSDRCYEAIVNQRLRATYSGRALELMHGQSDRLGPYRISCLSAQAVTYRPGCADAGLAAVSYLVARVE